MFLVEWPGGSWQATAQGVGFIFAMYIATLWIAMVFWTARDIHQRSRSSSVQLGSALLVLAFFLPGLWLYLILRPRLTLAARYERSLEAEAVLMELADRANCPECSRRVADDFLVCPSCTAKLKEPCVECARPLNFAWIACPGCGAEKEAREPIAAIALRPARRSSGRNKRAGEPEAAPKVPGMQPQQQAAPAQQLTIEGTPGS